MFPFNRLVIICRGSGGSLKLDVQCQVGGRILDKAGGGWGVLKIGNCVWQYGQSFCVYRPYILFLRSRETNAKCDNKKRKKSEARNIVAYKIFNFWFFSLDLVVLENCARM